MDIKEYKTPIVIFSILGILLLLYYLLSFFYLFETDAYIESNVVKVAPEVAGRVVKTYIKDLEHVKKGQLLFEIDQTRYLAQLNNAKSMLDNAIQNYNQLKAKKIAAIQSIKRAKASLSFQKSQLKRYQALTGGATISEEKKRQIVFFYQQSEANLAIAKANLDSIIASLGDETRPFAPIQKAKALLMEAEYNLSQTHYKSPITGYVTNYRLREGDYISRGQQLFALIDESRWWVLAKVKENYLPYLQTHNDVTIWLSSQHKFFHGHISGIAWGVNRMETSSRNKAWILPFLRQSEHWIQLAQRFPVRIDFDNNKLPLHFGANAKILVTLS